MPFQYKKVLVIGATSGIGEALTDKFINEGSQVIAVGRRKDRLEAIVHRNGKDNVSAVPFDITNEEAIPNFVTNVTQTHPDLDCVFLNSGIQRGFDFSKPETVDMEVIKQEFNVGVIEVAAVALLIFGKVNYIAFLSLTKAFLPFLLAKKTESALIYTTSNLAIVPLLRTPNYCASKAALHHFILALREQLKTSSVKVVEIYPPAVQTELHDEKHQPEFKGPSNFGMPLAEFTEEAFAGLAAGQEQIPVEIAKKTFEEVEIPRQAAFHRFTEAVAKRPGPKS